MGRGVESALMAHIAEEARQNGASRLRGSYLPTAKNAVVQTLYADHGFRRVEADTQGRTDWELDLFDTVMHVPSWLTLHTTSLATAC